MPKKIRLDLDMGFDENFGCGRITGSIVSFSITKPGSNSGDAGCSISVQYRSHVANARGATIVSSRYEKPVMSKPSRNLSYI